MDRASCDEWHKALVWSEEGKCPAPDQNKAPVEEHLSAPARRTLHRPCGASLSERWHRLRWLPEANRKQIVVLFSFFLFLQETAVGSKKRHCLLAWKKKVFFCCLFSVDESHGLIIVCSSSWSLMWSNSNYVPTFCFTWSKCRYTRVFSPLPVMLELFS